MHPMRFQLGVIVAACCVLTLIGCAPSTTKDRTAKTDNPPTARQRNARTAAEPAREATTPKSRPNPVESATPLPVESKPATEVSFDAALADARQRQFPTERAAAMVKLAQRDDLDTKQQIALIDAACEVGFSENIMDVMLALAQNPHLTDAAKKHLSKRLDCIPFRSDREQVQRALQTAR